MSEQQVTTTTAPDGTVHSAKTGVPAGAVRKIKKTVKKAVKKHAKTMSNGLSAQRVKMVKALQRGGASLAVLAKRTGMDEKAAYHQLWHLRKDGHVKSFDLDIDGKNEVQFDLKASGKKLV